MPEDRQYAIFAWQTLDGGEWGMIGAMLPDPTRPGQRAFTPLVTRSPDVANNMRPFAEQHRETSGNPIRLARYRLDEVLSYVG